MIQFKFKLRKFLAPDMYAACGVSEVEDVPPFSNDAKYLKYNEITGSGSLASKWNNSIILSAPITSEKFKEYFSRDWIEQDGIDVLFVEDNKVKSNSNELEFLIYAADKKAVASFNAIKDTITAWGIFEYTDNYNKVLKRLVLDEVDIVKNVMRDNARLIHFKLKCTNILGKDLLI